MAFTPLLALAVSALALASDPAVPPSPSPTPDPAAAAAAREDFPPGAPTDDYGFVSWCYGALRGHMDLYEVVKPDLNKLATSDAERRKNAVDDAEQMKAGEEYLALYLRAMTAAEKASIRPINERGADAVRQGHGIWTPAGMADPKTRMWSWLLWELPGRCETTAIRLESKSNLLGHAFGPSGSEAQPAPAPAPEPEAAPPEAPPSEAAPPEAAPPETAPPEAAPPAEPEPAAPPPPSSEVVTPPPEAQLPAESAPPPEASAAPPETPPPPEPKKGSFVVDPDNPVPCPGRLEPGKKSGKSVLICRM